MFVKLRQTPKTLIRGCPQVSAASGADTPQKRRFLQHFLRFCEVGLRRCGQQRVRHRGAKAVCFAGFGHHRAIPQGGHAGAATFQTG